MPGAAPYLNENWRGAVGTWVPVSDMLRLSDDGCPHHDEDDDLIGAGVVRVDIRRDADWLSASGSRIYVCVKGCGYYCWHPLSYCHRCGGRMEWFRGPKEQVLRFIESKKYKPTGY